MDGMVFRNGLVKTIVSIVPRFKTERTIYLFSKGRVMVKSVSGWAYLISVTALSRSCWQYFESFDMVGGVFGLVV
jgi:hypothetical protein